MGKINDSTIDTIDRLAEEKYLFARAEKERDEEMFCNTEKLREDAEQADRSYYELYPPLTEEPI